MRRLGQFTSLNCPLLLKASHGQFVKATLKSVPFGRHSLKATTAATLNVMGNTRVFHIRGMGTGTRVTEVVSVVLGGKRDPVKWGLFRWSAILYFP